MIALSFKRFCVLQIEYLLRKYSRTHVLILKCLLRLYGSFYDDWLLAQCLTPSVISCGSNRDLLCFEPLHSLPLICRSEKVHVKLPRTMEDAKRMGLVLSRYKDRFFFQVLGGVFVVYILYPFLSSMTNCELSRSFCFCFFLNLHPFQRQLANLRYSGIYLLVDYIRILVPLPFGSDTRLSCKLLSWLLQMLHALHLSGLDTRENVGVPCTE